MASDPFIQRHIRNLPLFARLTSEQIDMVARAAEVVRLQPGQLAFQQNQPTRGLMLFVAGRGVLTRLNENGVEEPVGSVETGQYINESALYATSRESASLRIVQPAVIILIPRGRFVNLLQHIPELRVNLRVETAGEHRETPRHLFKGQRDNETVLHIYRRHWWAFGRWLWIPVLIMIGGFATAAFLAPMNGIIALVAGGLGVIVPGVIIAYFYYEWQDDSVILTNQRVVRVWNTLFTFENTINEVPLDRILEISSEIPPGDAFARLFHYGTVAVRTSGANANIMLDFIPEPMKVQKMIFAQRDQFQSQNEQRRKEQIRSDIERALGRQPAQTQPISGAVALAAANEDGDPGDKSDSTVGPNFLRTKYTDVTGDIVYRKHASVWFAHILPSLLLLIASAVVFFASFVPSLPISGFTGIGLSVIGVVIGGLWFYWGDWDWRNDTFILGRDVITLIRKRPLFLQNQRDTIRLMQVDNVRSEVNGILNTLMNRGDVFISLIGAEATSKTFNSVYDPQEIQAEVSQRLSAIKAAQAQAQSDAQRQQMLDYFSVFQQVTGGDGRETRLTQAQPPQAPPPQTQSAPTSYPYSPVMPPPPDDETIVNPPPTRDGNRPPRVPRNRPGG